MSWVKLSRDSMATEEDWKTVTVVAEPDEEGKVTLFTEDKSRSLERLLERFQIGIRGRAHGWGADVWCIIYDSLEERYLTEKNSRSYLRFSTVFTALEYLKANF